MLELKELYKTFNPGTVNEKVALNGVSLTMDCLLYTSDAADE